MKIITSFKNLLVESLKDNKRLIIIFYVLFIITFIMSWILSKDIMTSFVANNMQNLRVMNPNAATTVSPWDIFITNEISGIVTYLASILFGLMAVFSIIYNGINLGMVGSMISSLRVNGGIQYIIYLIPHGIFEITALVIQSVAGILLFLFIYRLIKGITKNDNEDIKQKIGESFNNTKKILIQSIVLMIFSTILLIIAALIEAYLSVPISEFIVGFL